MSAGPSAETLRDALVDDYYGSDDVRSTVGYSLGDRIDAIIAAARADARADFDTLGKENVNYLTGLRDGRAEANPTTEEQELGRRLLVTGYIDEHRVEFQESGYGVQHPIECRPDLLGCRFNIWLRDNVGPEDFNPGRYRMDWSDDGPFFEMVSE